MSFQCFVFQTKQGWGDKLEYSEEERIELPAFKHILASFESSGVITHTIFLTKGIIPLPAAFRLRSSLSKFFDYHRPSAE
jgi:hypothetical protein